MGFLRLFLALCVIAGHSQTSVFGFLGINAWYAVNWFFLISGFYMAMVLNEKYKDTPVVTFYKSRALRLYPTYFVGVILSLLVSWPFYFDMFSLLTPVSKLFFIVQNIFIFGNDTAYLACYPMSIGGCINPIHMTINPPAWSLSIELIFYIVAPFILKSPKKTFLYLLSGIFYLLLVNKINYPITSMFKVATHTHFVYYWYPSSFVFFAIGSLSYQFSKGMIGKYYLPALIAIALSSYTVTVMPIWQAVVIGLAIPSLFALTKRNKIDRIIGEMSFPAYILHWPILMFIKGLGPKIGFILTYISIGTLVAILSCMLGFFLYITMEKKIDKYRHESLTSDHDNIIRSLAKLVIMPIIFIAPFASLFYIIY